MILIEEKSNNNIKKIITVAHFNRQVKNRVNFEKQILITF